MQDNGWTPVPMGSYDENVRLVEETLQAGKTVCGMARRHGVAAVHLTSTSVR